MAYFEELSQLYHDKSVVTLSGATNTRSKHFRNTKVEFYLRYISHGFS
jgi:hypothetical protein